MGQNWAAAHQNGWVDRGKTVGLRVLNGPITTAATAVERTEAPFLESVAGEKPLRYLE